MNESQVDRSGGRTGPRAMDLPRIQDPRGNLTYVESNEHLPFAIQRVYWIYDVPGGERRGGHAYRTLHECIVSLSGSFDVVVTDGDQPERVTLNRSYRTLYVPPLRWRHLENFSTNAVCLIFASGHYDEDDYLRDWDTFLSLR